MKSFKHAYMYYQYQYESNKSRIQMKAIEYDNINKVLGSPGHVSVDDIEEEDFPFIIF